MTKTAHDKRVLGARFVAARGVIRLLASASFAALGCMAQSSPGTEDDAALAAQPEQVSSAEQALSADPGPKDLTLTYDRFDRIVDARSDETYVLFRYWRDADRGCFGRVARAPVGGGEIVFARAPCGTRDFTIHGDDVYFAATRYSYSQSGGIFRSTFGVDGWVQLTGADAHAIASDEDYLYWNDGAALHRVLHDGYGDELLADGAAAVAPLLLDDASIYGYDRSSAALWKVSKEDGEKTSLATVERVSNLQLDGGELFWVRDFYPYVDGTQLIQRLSVAGGSPSTVHSTTQGVRGLAVEGAWVYWSSGLDIMRAARTGGRVSSVDTAEPSSEVIGADATNVYYTRWTTPAPPFLMLRRLPIADLVAPACGDKTRTLVTAAQPIGLAASGTWVYYSEGNTVRRVWKNGGSVETMAVDQPGARALHVDEKSLSWVTDEGVNTTPFGWPPAGKLYAAEAEDVIGAGDGREVYYTDGTRIVGPGGSTLATGIAPYRLARDESFLYWTDSGDGTVQRVPLAGGSGELLARVESGELGDLALGPDNVFFAVDHGARAKLLRVEKTGGATALVTRGAFSPLDLDASGAFLYFTSQGPGNQTVYRVAKDGGRAVPRVKRDTAFELDTLGRCIYFATDAQIAVVSKR